ncbi:hypothetical protein Dimus_012428 [Dionaea muscipula]
MSASTVSITANTAPTARRRPVVIADRKQNVELVNDVAISPSSGGGGADKFTVGGDGGVGAGTGAAMRKDLSPSIRGEVILERSKELLQVSKSQPRNSTSAPLRRTRKTGLTKPEKPRWQIVLSIFTKNFVLLLVLLGLFQMVRKLVVNYRTEESSGSLLGFTDMEGRIAEVDSLLKSVTQMMQVQLDTVDKKLEGELGGLRRELTKKIEEKTGQLEIAFRKLDERGEALDEAVTDLGKKDFLTRDNFVSFYEELKKAKVGMLGQKELTLDDISALAREIVEREIQKHAADGLGKVDYALASGGARVVKHSQPLLAVKGNNWLKPVGRTVHEDAQKMLTPSFGEPGQCFALNGSSGFVDVRLKSAIVIEAITLEHVAKNVAYDRSSAPKDCKIAGWFQDSQSSNGFVDEVAVDAEKMFLLTEFTYDLEKSNAQTFNVLDSAGSAVIDTIRFEFTSNHGNPSFTCIYRLRVHGVEARSLSIVATDT